MVDVIIQQSGNSYRAIDTMVSTGDEVQIMTTDPNVSFKVVVPNADGFFDQQLDCIYGTVDKLHPLYLGTVTGNGKSIKYFEIIPSIDAPPRIIRLT